MTCHVRVTGKHKSLPNIPMRVHYHDIGYLQLEAPSSDVWSLCVLVIAGMQSLRSLLIRFPRNRCRALSTNQQGYPPSLSVFSTYVTPCKFSRGYAASNAPRLDEPVEEAVDSVEEDSPRSPSRLSSIKKLNQALARRKIPELVEEELEEQFVRGIITSVADACPLITNRDRLLQEVDPEDRVSEKKPSTTLITG